MSGNPDGTATCCTRSMAVQDSGSLFSVACLSPASAVKNGELRGQDTSPHFSHACGCWLVPCRANRFSHLANTPGIGGGANTCWHDNALRHHPATA